ncbi:MAG: hypothetical protein J1D86_00095 [Alistipes sp.]|nr:hypothetical protein [Alistipes sp.]
MSAIVLKPTADQTFEISGGDFGRILASSRRAEQQGQTERACNIRLEAFRLIAAALPEDEPTPLERSDSNTLAAMEIVFASAIDHFLIDDFEMSAAMLEMLSELDPEGYCGWVEPLAWNYLALGEMEAFDDIAADIPDRTAAGALIHLWATMRRQGALDAAAARAFMRDFGHCGREFTAAEHPADEAYMKDICSQSPSKAAQARELWLQTENLWRRFPEFIEALKALA